MTTKYKLIQIVRRLAWMLHSKRLTIGRHRYTLKLSIVQWLDCDQVCSNVICVYLRFASLSQVQTIWHIHL